MRPRLIAVDDHVEPVKVDYSYGASMRPRLIAVDDLSAMRQFLTEKMLQ